MNRRMFIALTFFFLLPFNNAIGDVAVLIHGYLGHASSWQEKGVIDELQRYGWRSGKKNNDSKVFYTIDLPSEAPIKIQANYLHKKLVRMRKRHANERIVLVGHSAGGVVARQMMISNPKLKIYGLVTIASPHLGTDRAEKALQVSKSPLSLLAPLLGVGTLNRSRGLYADLKREKPGNFLAKLNHESHPDAKYVSIIRAGSSGNGKDAIVPIYSQDMRNIQALQGKAKSYWVNTEHGLSRADGKAIAGVLHEMFDA